MIRKIVRENGGWTFYNPSNKEVEKIKDDLTFKNPKYDKVVRYSKWSTTRVPRYLMYYETGSSFDAAFYIHVPFGYSLAKFHDAVDLCTDPRISAENSVSFPSFRLELRETQKEAVEAFEKEKHGIVILPTGKGKTILTLYLMSRLNVRTLVLVHKNDLLDGWKKDAKKCYGEDFETGLIQGKNRKICPFTLATVQTLSRMSAEELSKYTSMFDFVVQDECHRSPAPMFAMTDKFNAKYKLGLTATMERSDGLAHLIPLYFGDVVYRYEVDDDEKDILPVKVFRRDIPVVYDPLFDCTEVPARYSAYGMVSASYLKLKLSENDEREEGQVFLSEVRGKKKVFDDFSLVDLDNAAVLDPLTIHAVLQDVVREYREGHSCVVFFSLKEHVRRYLAELSQIGEVDMSRVALYYGDNSDKENEHTLERAENREVLITLTTFSKSGEGTNCRSWEVAFFVSSTPNGRVVEQSVGRIRRTKEGKISPARLYDYSYSKVATYESHAVKRLARYHRLGFLIEGNSEKKSLFHKGFFKRGRS